MGKVLATIFGYSIAFVAVIGVIVLIFLGLSWGLMALLNVVLNHFGVQLIDYNASMAVIGLLAIVGIMTRSSSVSK